MSTPRTKRQFAGAAADPSQRQITSFFKPPPVDASPLQAPMLPAAVQANLLTVGMRVRKSVPEGYKTASSSVFKLWTDNTPPSSFSSPPSTLSPPSTILPTTTVVKPAARELLPFCGINKIGGLAAQPDFEDDVPGLDDVPEFTISQESVVSVVESRKRPFDEEEVEEVGVSILGGGNRVLAVPRTRKGAGQENDDDFDEAGFLVAEGQGF